ncbi:MAG: Gfo/Idh/MocA family oxidoreductase [Gemmatimonadales bacterium]|nr:Gfo/Idh/MocA family oxidoreductase [Gemmatimonadales bacterium]NIN10193.1 Gfo/Idh/MocA family oxidoreductase [Gemmatimonadales bacterium]NIN48949.1 Gfo/Idh/MocA family oxidoreductase [Gemmatimonadales bacterium]NIP06413.1 Gfo/Idh/MocA family oxidoreductase [Gemmatimonadales bacterium]NIQ98765.1 Gfo/Idh/MocA family oxidoreductase [Gemmatimonadales bacterium]
MTTRRLGVGLIGGGFVGKFHVRSWVGVRDSDILGVVARPKEAAQDAVQLARRLGVGDAKVFGSVTDMVADPSIDALWICAPNFTRIEIMEEIADAIESGKGELVGVACEKPLGRNVAEARKMLELVQQAGLLDGYLENQLFSPAVVRGKDILWSRGAALTGPPYLARCAEEHSGPHMPWFWEGELQGGGVLNDMACHSVEVARFLLTPPGAERGVLTPVKVSAHTSCLKWQQPHYAGILAENSGGKTDYINRPAEDFARVLVEYRDQEGNERVVEATTSWCFVGAGLRLSMELLGPEYSLSVNSLDAGPKVFFSRQVTGDAGEDLVEKQNAEMGLMPVVSDEESEYGYVGEDRHMVQSFLAGKRPEENFSDGVNVAELLMTAYMSAEQEKTIAFPPPDLESFVPAVAKGEWNPRRKQ